METARHPAPAPSSRYYHPYPPSTFLHDIHPALIHQYISYYTEPLAPLDLSVKQTPITPPCTPPPNKSDEEAKKNAPKIFRHFEDDDDREEREPEKRRHDEDSEDSSSPEAKKLKFTRKFFEDLKSCLPDRAATPGARNSPEVVEIREVQQRPKKVANKISAAPTPTPTKRSKVVRHLQFDEDKTSPVSGTIIRDLAEDETLVVRKGDIDPAFNVVEVTEEAKALIAGIDNKLGRYICRLCCRLYQDAFALAQHRCERIVHIEYRCPECDKVFNCPANLASHRRWHKPRVAVNGKASGGGAAASRTSASGEPTPLDGVQEGTKFACKVCGKTFRRQAYLRKHYLAHDAAGKLSLEQEITSPSPGEELQTAPGARSECSAFRQVRPEYGTVYSRSEPLRDNNYNTFWGKLPRTDFSFGDAYYERPLEMSRNYASSIASSEDSRSLDITGSEDEGSGGGGN